MHFGKLLFGSLVILIGCKAEFDAKIYLSDVIAIASGSASTDAKAILSIDATSADNCAEFKDAIRLALMKGFSTAEFVACRSAELTTFADFRVSVPMIKLYSDLTTALGLVVGQVDKKIFVSLHPVKAKIDAIKAALPSEMTTLASDQIDPQVSMTVINDLTDPMKVATQGAFVDGQPYQFTQTFDLARRDELRIALSDVGNASLYRVGSLMFLLEAP